MIKRYLVLAAILTASFSAAQAQTPGNPDNWCRNGAFPTDSQDFKIGKVKSGAKAAKKVYFYNDYAEDCPTNESCREKSYVVPGNEVIVSRVYKSFACSWYVPVKGIGTTGWIRLADLDINDVNKKPPVTAWLGDWEFAENSISFTRNKLPGYLNVKGEAFWRGSVDNVHIGELDGREKPVGNIINFGSSDTDEYACKATIRLIGNFLVVDDNSNCGGVNVRFDGVYRRKK
ncbi:MAG: hypothetical protein K1X36_13175 [Pyrinomonadaceae bacterium]|nr:hypothetical protein [Pyrinomonadaceae bacterium]